MDLEPTVGGQSRWASTYRCRLSEPGFVVLRLFGMTADSRCQMGTVVGAEEEHDVTGALSLRQVHMRLDRKVAHITGAARGIGAAIARAFAREGAWVVVSDLDAAGAQSLVREIGDDALALTLDVREEDQWRAAQATILDRFSRLDVLVNNAGITGFEDTAALHDPEHATLNDWRVVHATNLDGVFLGCKYAIQAMRRTGAGSITTSRRALALSASQRRRPMPRRRPRCAITLRRWRSIAQSRA